MPKKIPITTIRDWLEQYEQGKSEATISREARRDPRTVRRGIQMARQERDTRTARSDMVRMALQKHQTDLFEVVESLQKALVVPPPNMPAFSSEPVSQVLHLSEGDATWRKNQGWTFQSIIESSPKWGLFQEHMGHDPLIKLLSRWKEQVLTHLEDKRVFRDEVIRFLQKVTKLSLIESIDKDSPKQFLYYPGVLAFYNAVLNWSLGHVTLTNIKEQLKVFQQTLSYGAAGFTLLSADNAEQFKKQIMTGFDQWTKIGAQVFNNYQSLTDITARSKREVEELSLLGLIPGNCRVCRRLGL